MARPSKTVELVQTDTSAKARISRLLPRLRDELSNRVKMFTEKIKGVDDELSTLSSKKKTALETADTEKLRKYTREYNDLIEVKRDLEQARENEQGKGIDVDKIEKMFDELRAEANTILKERSEKSRNLVREALAIDEGSFSIATEYNELLREIASLDKSSNKHYAMIDFSLYPNVSKTLNEYNFEKVNARLKGEGS